MQRPDVAVDLTFDSTFTGVALFAVFAKDAQRAGHYDSNSKASFGCGKFKCVKSALDEWASAEYFSAESTPH